MWKSACCGGGNSAVSFDLNLRNVLGAGCTDAASGGAAQVERVVERMLARGDLLEVAVHMAPRSPVFAKSGCSA